jgi:hypothetical protein
MTAKHPYPGKGTPLLESFLRKVEPDLNSGCWLWSGALSNRGYGQVRVNGSTLLAHRQSLSLFVGPVPPSLWAHLREGA